MTSSPAAIVDGSQSERTTIESMSGRLTFETALQDQRRFRGGTVDQHRRLGDSRPVRRATTGFCSFISASRR